MTLRYSPAPSPARDGAPAPLPRDLLADGALRLELAPALLAAAELWLPLLPDDPTRGRRDAAVIRLADTPAPSRTEGAEGRPTLRLGGVGAWVRDDAARVLLDGAGGVVRGEIDLGARTAALHAPRAATLAPQPGDEVHSSLTLASALLLGRLERALVHAAAVVDPQGGAWLLVGDSHAGKTTTTVNLIGAGWGWVSDDQVVLGRGEGGTVTVEGWPRRFHLDAGWEAGTPGQPRGEVDPRGRWPGRWRRGAPLAGLLFPRVHADRPTGLTPVAGSEVLAPLIRQSPWLLADRGAAAGVLALLQEAAARPAFALSLGLDTYRGGAPLLAALAPLAATGGAAG